MKLSNLLNSLSVGELSQYNIGSANTGSISEEDYPKLLPLINAALLNIYTELPIKFNEIVIIQQHGKLVYRLDSENVITGSETPSEDKYIFDQVLFPFTDDIITLDTVSNEFGEVLPINDTSKPNAVFTVDAKTLRLSPGIVTECIGITYHAKPPEISLNDLMNSDKTRLDVPDFLLEAVLLYVASRFFRGKGTVEGISLGNTLMMEYHGAIERIKTLGLVKSETHTANKFEANGWV